MSIELSIIVPVYNASEYLHKCIESIKKKTFDSLEIILINDGSTDNSGEICEKYCDSDKRISVYHIKNSGPGAARNFGIKKAKGRYVGFVDSDDYIHQDMYRRLLEPVDLNKESIQVIMCNYKYLNMRDNSSFLVKHPVKHNIILKKEDIRKNVITKFSENENYGFYSLCNKIYLREWLLQNNNNITHLRDNKMILIS